jgi:acyl-CoA thioesterase
LNRAWTTLSSGSAVKGIDVTAGRVELPGARTPEEEKYQTITEDQLESSPFYRRMGLKVTDIGPGRVVFEVRAERQLWNAGGMPHGNAIASIAYSASGAALATLLEKDNERPVTVELKVNFCSPAEEGVLHARARVVQKGKRIAVCEFDVTGTNGELVAKGISTYKVQARDR